MRHLLILFIALIGTASWAQNIPTLKLLHTYTPEPIVASLGFGGDVAIYDGKMYVGAWNNSAKYINSYSILSDGALSFLQQITNSNNQFGWSVAASNNYLITAAASAKKLIIHPLNGKEEYVVELQNPGSSVALDGNTLLLTVKGRIEIFNVSDTELSSLFALSQEKSTISIGTKPAIKGNMAAVNDRTNKRVIIFEKINGTWAQTAMVNIPDATSNIFGLAIGDDHIFSGDRGSGYIYDIVKQNGSWSIRQIIKDGEGTSLGSFLAYDNGNLVAICNYSSTKPYNDSYVFTLDSSGNWKKSFTIKNNEDLLLGSVAAISGKNIYISCYNAMINELKNVGAVYHYRLDATENTTPIRNIENDRYQNTDIYDLQGRRITGKPQKGLYIQNGKLISVK